MSEHKHVLKAVGILSAWVGIVSFVVGFAEDQTLKMWLSGAGLGVLIVAALGVRWRLRLADREARLRAHVADRDAQIDQVTATLSSQVHALEQQTAKLTSERDALEDKCARLMSDAKEQARAHSEEMRKAISALKKQHSERIGAVERNFKERLSTEATEHDEHVQRLRESSERELATVQRQLGTREEAFQHQADELLEAQAARHAGDEVRKLLHEVVHTIRNYLGLAIDITDPDAFERAIPPVLGLVSQLFRASSGCEHEYSVWIKALDMPEKPPGGTSPREQTKWLVPWTLASSDEQPQGLSDHERRHRVNEYADLWTLLTRDLPVYMSNDLAEDFLANRYYTPMANHRDIKTLEDWDRICGYRSVFVSPIRMPGANNGPYVIGYLYIASRHKNAFDRTRDYDVASLVADLFFPLLRAWVARRGESHLLGHSAQGGVR